MSINFRNFSAVLIYLRVLVTADIFRQFYRFFCNIGIFTDFKDNRFSMKILPIFCNTYLTFTVSSSQLFSFFRHFFVNVTDPFAILTNYLRFLVTMFFRKFDRFFCNIDSFMFFNASRFLSISFTDFFSNAGELFTIFSECQLFL